VPTQNFQGPVCHRCVVCVCFSTRCMTKASMCTSTKLCTQTCKHAERPECLSLYWCACTKQSVRGTHAPMEAESTLVVYVS
jgi:hypothetical protein